MLIYADTITPRTSYIFNLLIKDMLGVAVRLTNNMQTFTESDEPKLAYCNQRAAGGIFIECTSLLFERGVRPTTVDCFEYKQHKALFAGSGDLPFDIFAASFYLLSRYEEYLPTEKDQYGRFQAKNTLGYKHHFHQKPVINFWVEELKELISKRYPELRCKPSTFKATISFDIDVAFAFKGRSIFTTLFGAGRDLLSFRFQQLNERVKVLQEKTRDPFDSYEYIKKTLLTSNADHLFFFLLKKERTRFDRNISPASEEIKHLIASVSSFSQVGLHPSYYSSESPKFLIQEKVMLESLLQASVTKSRQHYLRWQLPTTFQQLIDAGIADDYSMGFAELPGFRAGISTPFLFYNLMSEESTSLTIHPVSYMDGSFIEDLGMTPEESLVEIKKIISEVKKVNGHFHCIWHNHTLSDYGIYKGWRKPFEETLRLINETE